ncbi:TPA: citrate lyase holo-[acyl-carrier protein] synthase [Streptococcus equi subsp. zooepidemicus]|uniref:citrate lyase holo-[acyl-carrier protein] synthase n=1 Tax=Streptococcus equi TaxID=1336 RepID=UPI0019814C96|nr:citrate lyase holo-[acyl-carrier protein] synthase [Streptococcus equi]MCD3367981.1 citrate lyase holo-[acyl-carrier protein] synthase [Streptococcus equi subsp. zooepidemicus]MCD3467918.1 citrate lyase holo-[acyl-carrier protein] synthase [Streptococcus equi subsp. zooepidemicus]QTZ29513.1 Apo-citrate lyase phosphoribosyl-dephospho-CoA transferase [Streptococcus equi subsp. zooepidemicus]UFR19480.1 citrate lyase holo-[acyl-carrier protein] synthase [Streptococcus equi subsp. zooepidemicus]
MSKELIFKGEAVTLADMLRAREDRSLRQGKLLTEFSNESLLSVTMNIPGPIKTSPALLEVFDSVIKAILEKLSGNQISYQLRLLPKTGYEYYLVTALDSQALKLKMIELEADLPIGRLMDLDVLVMTNQLPTPISRTALGFPPRSCYLCSKEAKACSRNRSHSVADMQAALAQLLQSFFEGDNQLS